MLPTLKTDTPVLYAAPLSGYSYKVALANGTGLRTMLGQPFHLGAFDTIQFIYDDSTLNWVEINRSQNRWSN